MNWSKAIRTILGKFWYVIFKELDFIFGIEFLESLYAKLLERGQQNWFAGLIAKHLGIQQDALPFVLYIKYPMEKRYYSLDEALLADDGGMMAAANPSAEWAGEIANTTPIPYTIQNHVFKYTKTLLNDLDFRYSNGVLLVYANPETLDWTIIRRATPTGELQKYYRVFGTHKQMKRAADMVYGLLSPELVEQADTVWAMHQTGASWLLTKKLIGAYTDTVISENAGIVASVWTENNVHCVLVGDRVYHSTSLPVVSAGNVVGIGDVLFGTSKFYPAYSLSGSTLEDIADKLPAITVQTDVGLLVAKNTTTDAMVTAGGENVLPLLNVAGGTSTSYLARCSELEQDPDCPHLTTEIGPTVNPFEFVLQVLRRGRDGVVIITERFASALGPALACIRAHMNTGGILGVYVNTETATRALAITANSEATLTAVADDGDLGITTNGAEANLII